MSKHIGIKKCDCCKINYKEDQLLDYSFDTYHGLVCLNCCTHGNFNFYHKNLEKHKKEKILSKKINLNQKGYCPICNTHSYDINKKVCTNRQCTTKELDTMHYIRQRLEFSEFMCPFCLSLHTDLKNKICMDCKSHISLKSIKKKFRRGVKKGEANKKKDDEACTICGNKSIWKELHYCFLCKQVYAICMKKEDGSTLKGIIKNETPLSWDKNRKTWISHIYNSKKSIRVFDISTPIRILMSVEFSRKELEEITGIKSIVLDKPKGGMKEMIKIETDEFKEFSWVEEAVKLTGITATATVRFLEGSPQIPILISYEIDDIEKHIAETIPTILEDKK